MKVAIVGLAVENEAALRYWQQKGADITVCDQNPSTIVPEGVGRQLGANYLDNLDQFDVIVRTVGMHPRLILEKNPNVQEKITTAINIFFSECKVPIIGVTGTKGKGTTSTLIAQMLEAGGKKVLLGGNIGIPLLDLLQDSANADFVVAELSSFQLIDLKQSPHIAVCLMVVPEHLDWHEDFEEYIAAKQQMFINQDTDDIAIYYAKNETSESIADASMGTQIPYFEKPGAVVEDDRIMIDNNIVCETHELKLLGEHNWQNICAAVTAVWQITQDIEAIQKVATSFSGLEHRLEFVRELDGIKYYDDSFGTTPETAIVAIEAFAQPKVLILGGSTKGSIFKTLARTIATNTIRQVILIGNTAHPHYQTAAPDIETTLQAEGVEVVSVVKPGGSTMNEIVKMAHDAAQSGDVVLLSTACASFDMFKNYKDRGDQFKAAVQALS